MTFFNPKIKVSLFVATADKDANPLPVEQVETTVLNAENCLRSIGATGFSTQTVEGGWWKEDGTLIREETRIVTAFINGINELDRSMLSQWAELTKLTNSQDSVLVTIERISQAEIWA